MHEELQSSVIKNVKWLTFSTSNMIVTLTVAGKKHGNVVFPCNWTAVAISVVVL